ncbi:hypothetical protein D3C78_1404110 [compost metagenome]
MLFAPVNGLVEAVHHDRYVQLLDFLPDREQAFVVCLDAIEIGAADADALGTQVLDGAFYFPRRRFRLSQVGMAPEVEVLRILAAIGGHLIVADARVLGSELSGPVHEGVRGRGNDQLVHATLGHQPATASLGHAGQQIGLGLRVVLCLGRLLGA